MRAREALLVVAVSALALTLVACAPEEPREAPPRQSIPEADIYEPWDWGKPYPKEYASWKETQNPPNLGSKYKRGGEEGREFDKLSEYPYMAAMTAGIGFAVEYNEPRGHWYALIDQQRIDPSRLKAGGVCLSCKTSYYLKLREEVGASINSMPYKDAIAKVPDMQREQGVACIDCHDNKTMRNRPARRAVLDAMKVIGLEKPDATQTRLLTCGQCHCTYVIPKEKGKSQDVVLPWEGGEPGDVSVEDVISYIRKNAPRTFEWTQTLTGFRLGYIRHPEYEFYTRDSTHYRNGVTCPDCHMPAKVESETKFTDHDVRSPLTEGMRGCIQCHDQEPGELKDAVVEIQDRYVSATLKCGFAVTTDARLLSMLHERMKAGAKVDRAAYDRAKTYYELAFYRAAYLGAENSVGFHNPVEGSRIAADCLAYAGRSEGILRQLLASAGVKVPAEVDLQLDKYIDQRGDKKLRFEPKLEFKDPWGTVDELYGENLKALRGK